MRTGHRMKRNLRRGLRRPFRRRGSLLGLVGMVALGVTLLEKNRRERIQEDPCVEWDSDNPNPV